MLDTSKQAIAAIVKADPSVSQRDRARLIAYLNNPEPATSTTPGKILKRRIVAERAGRSVRTIDNWTKAGLLRAVKLPGQTRAIGFRAADVEALLGGGEK